MEEKIESSVNFQQQQIERNDTQRYQSEKKEKVVQKYSIYKSYLGEFDLVKIPTADANYFDLIVIDILDKLEHLNLDDSVQVGKVINLLKVDLIGCLEIYDVLQIDSNVAIVELLNGDVMRYKFMDTECTRIAAIAVSNSLFSVSNYGDVNGKLNIMFVLSVLTETSFVIKIVFEINVQGWNNGNVNYDDIG